MEIYPFTTDIGTPQSPSPKAGAEALALPCHALPQQDGVLVLDKPQGPSSAWCIGRVKKGLGQKKIGHAGTLDPMATGVLIVLLGQATKLSGYLMEGGEKTYSGVIRLGLVTDTWDAAGKVIATNTVAVSSQELEKAFGPLLGTYEQEVPAYAAAKHQGKPLYALARQGLATPVKKKVITISRGEAELVGLERVRFRVTCSSGTYIRSLAHSLGIRLGCGAMLEELTREYSHPFDRSQAHSLESLFAAPESFVTKVVGIAAALPHWPTLQLDAAGEAKIRQGIALAYTPGQLEQTFAPGHKALLAGPDGKPLALAVTAVTSGRQVWSILRGLWNQEP